MYNVPSRTGCNIQPATVATLVKNVKNIVGLKAASGDLSQIAKTVSLAGADLELYSGNDDQVLIDAIPLINALFCEVNPIPVKTALNLMGMNVGPLRMPLCEMEESNKETLKKALQDFGIKLA